MMSRVKILNHNLRVIFIMLFLALCSATRLVQAGEVELAGTFAFSQSNYGNDNYQWSRRWGASIGYLFWKGMTEIEYAMEDGYFRTKIAGYADTYFHDEVYSLNWVQHFAGRRAAFRPYFKVGAGQLNRTAGGVYASGGSPAALYDALTGVLGVGLRVFVLDTIGIKAEATTYLPGAVLSTWQQNFAVHFGLSLYL